MKVICSLVWLVVCSTAFPFHSLSCGWLPLVLLREQRRQWAVTQLHFFSQSCVILPLFRSLEHRWSFDSPEPLLALCFSLFQRCKMKQRSRAVNLRFSALNATIVVWTSIVSVEYAFCSPVGFLWHSSWRSLRKTSKELPFHSARLLLPDPWLYFLVVLPCWHRQGWVSSGLKQESHQQDRG